MKKTKVFITEDEFIVSQNLKHKLINLGYDVVGVASSGEQALIEIRNTNPDLILMDIMLSGELDGIDVAKEIKEHFNIPLIFLTAYSSKEIYQRAEITEPYAYIIKPFEERELEINISIALYKHNAEKRLKEKQIKLELLNKNLDLMVQERTLELIKKNNELKLEIENRKKIKEKEERLAEVIKQAEDHILITNKKGDIEYLNPKMIDFIGYRKDEVVGKNPRIIKSGKQQPSFYKNMWETISSGKIFKGEFINQKKNGELYVAQEIIVPLINSKNEITHYASIGRDITDKRDYEKKMIIIQESEKQRVSKELHDGIGQEITAIKYSIMALMNELDVSKESKTKFKDIVNQIDNLTKELRIISFNLLPSLLEDYGLNAAIKKVISNFNESTEVEILLKGKTIEKRYPKNIELGIFRVFQEALNNSVKHSKAKNINIDILQSTNKLIELKIHDDGIGFNINKVKKGQGINNMEQRIHLLNGTFSLNSNENKGTIIHIEVPIK